MRWPRFRLTVRRMMTAITVLGICLGTGVLAFRCVVDFKHSYHLRGQHPIARELYLRLVGPGDDVEALIRRIPPHMLRRRGPYVSMSYFPRGPLSRGGISLAATQILAKEGKVMSAGSGDCTWQLEYFDHLGPDEHAEFWRLLRLQPGCHPELGDGPN